MSIKVKTAEQLLIESITRQVIEDAARRIEAMQGNPTYVQAWRLAVRALRTMKRD